MTLRNHEILFIALTILYLLYVPSVSSNLWEDSHKFTTYRHGQNYEGLSKVKKYLHQLGYMPNVSPSNLDNHFDDNLISAIKTYQNFYKLNPTGKLDHDTVQDLMMPRCGFPDIIHSNTKMSSGSDNADSLHTVSHYSFANNKRWQVNRLTYAFGDRLPKDFITVIVRALNRWKSTVKINFQEANLYRFSDIQIDFYKGKHGDRNPFDGPLGELAHATPPTYGTVHFDAEEAWVTTGDVTKARNPNATDLESVAVHEFGHTLGLGHSDKKSAIMYAKLPPKTKKVSLTDDDIKGMRALYNINA